VILPFKLARKLLTSESGKKTSLQNSQEAFNGQKYVPIQDHEGVRRTGSVANILRWFGIRWVGISSALRAGRGVNSAAAITEFDGRGRSAECIRYGREFEGTAVGFSDRANPIGQGEAEGFGF
jgi:hypothetical protein